MNSFFRDLSVFCNHLAPVLGPLVERVGHTASAIDSAQRETARLQGEGAYFDNIRPALHSSSPEHD